MFGRQVHRARPSAEEDARLHHARSIVAGVESPGGCSMRPRCSPSHRYRFAAEAAHARTAQQLGRDLVGRTALLVDDDAAILVEQRVRRRACMLTATTGKEAVEIVEAGRTGDRLMDIMMPK